MAKRRVSIQFDQWTEAELAQSREEPLEYGDSEEMANVKICIFEGPNNERERHLKKLLIAVLRALASSEGDVYVRLGRCHVTISDPTKWRSHRR